MNSPQAKQFRLNQLREAWTGCRACPLHEKRKNIVHGYGNVDADVMLIGEAPGATEDDHGLPFLGNAGQLLDQYLGQVSIRPDVLDVFDSKPIDFRQLRHLLLEDYFYTNVVCCRPPDNRDPFTGEADTCRPRLLEMLYTVDPLIVVALGKIAATALLGRAVSITRERGKLYEINMTGRRGTYKLPVMVMLHPSFLARENSFGPGSPEIGRASCRERVSSPV